MNSKLFSNLNEASQAVSASTFAFEPVSFPQLKWADGSKGTYTFEGTELEFTLGHLGLRYIAYRTNKRIARRPETQGEFDSINEHMKEAYGSYAIASIVDGELVALLSDYVPLQHSDILAAFNSHGIFTRYAFIGGFVDKVQMQLSFVAQTYENLMLRMHVCNGTAGTVGFRYRVSLNAALGERVQWNVPIASSINTRHLEGRYDNLGEAVAYFEDVVNELAEEVYTKALSVVVIDETALYELAKTENEKAIIAEIADPTKPFTLLEVLEALAIVAQQRGRKTAATTLIRRVTKIAPQIMDY